MIKSKFFIVVLFLIVIVIYFVGDILKLLPLQGAGLNAMIPRALPWARRGCPFGAQGDLQPLFEPVLHAGSQQGFEILDGLLNLRFLSLDLLYALGKETLEGERWKRQLFFA